MKQIIILLLLSFSFGFSVKAQDWNYDLKVAEQKATETNRHIILVFQGSDWCASCIKLQKEVWSTKEFIDYADKHFIMLKADFPKRKQNQLSEEQKEKNSKLAELYNKNGYFPFVVVLDKDGKVLGETGYKKISPLEYVKLLESF